MAANWADKPSDLLVQIAKRVQVMEDFIAFRGVCTSWRTAATKDNFSNALTPQLPLLMLADHKDGDYRKFYSLSKGKVSRILHLPEARGRPCLPLSHGWLLTTTYIGDFNGEFNLLHPFSHTQIRLPPERNLWALQGVYEFENFPKPQPFSYCISNAVLSANPSLTSDYVLVISYNTDNNHFAFWRPGDLNWTTFDIEDRVGCASDMIYYKGKFYCVTYAGNIWIFDIAGPNIPQPIIESQLVVIDDALFNDANIMFYLIELNGELVLVQRLCHYRGDLKNETYKFKVYELDLHNAELKEISTLGNSTIILVLNGSRSVDSSKFMGVKPNHIYFTDDWMEFFGAVEGGAGKDMGVYNFEDGKVESFYHGLSLSPICPPTWVTPSL